VFHVFNILIATFKDQLSPELSAAPPSLRPSNKNKGYHRDVIDSQLYESHLNVQQLLMTVLNEIQKATYLKCYCDSKNNFKKKREKPTLCSEPA
jgi:hypothetical protein